ncbi:MAG: 50S ribosomal protein L11 methyltransferase [Bacteroidales bacterium]|nr:50S ribosomal protein L11 methyltransferase [Bacteroidales bacterium]
MEYIAVSIPIELQKEEIEEILVAELAQINYEGFLSEDSSLKAYIPIQDFNEPHLKLILDTYGMASYTKEYIVNENWNADWEIRFHPIVLETGKGCSIRSTGEGSMVPVWPPVAYKLIIKPQLAFGTGHHPTTFMMLESLLTLDKEGHIKNRRIADLGTGTGVLAILAAKMGAALPIHALDNDRRSIHSCRENARLNGVEENLRIYHTDASFIQAGRYGMILANLHRNILSQEMDTLSRGLEPGTSHLLISGFYTKDVPALIETAQKNGLTLYEQKENETWSLLHFIKTC